MYKKQQQKKGEIDIERKINEQETKKMKVDQKKRRHREEKRKRKWEARCDAL